MPDGDWLIDADAATATLLRLLPVERLQLPPTLIEALPFDARGRCLLASRLCADVIDGVSDFLRDHVNGRLRRLPRLARAAGHDCDDGDECEDVAEGCHELG